MVLGGLCAHARVAGATDEPVFPKGCLCLRVLRPFNDPNQLPRKVTNVTSTAVSAFLPQRKKSSNVQQVQGLTGFRAEGL